MLMHVRLGFMKGLLFDLDGTLVNTLEDIRCALNHVLELCYARPIDSDECKSVVGHGLRKALIDALWLSRSAFPEDEFDILYKELISYYSGHVCIHSAVYDGMTDFLEEARGRGFVLGVLSNKQDALAREIISRLFAPDLFSFAAGLRENSRPKPDNPAVFDFIKLCNADASDVTIIGDSEVDWQTACRAGTDSIIVTYGYRKREDLEKAGITRLADSIAEVRKLLWN